MSEQSVNILDKVISSSHQTFLQEFNPQSFVFDLLKDLSDREKEVIIMRHGLNNEEKKTLEEIGKKYKVTRERVRQIEKSSLKKLKKIDDIMEKIKPIEVVVFYILDRYHGVIHEDLLIEELANFSQLAKEHKNSLFFLIEQFLMDKLTRLQGHNKIHDVLLLPTVDQGKLNETVTLLQELIFDHGQPATLDEILEFVKSHQLLGERLSDKQILHSYLYMAKNIEKNPFHEWGIKDWSLISLKKMSDKVFLVLKKEKNPLHFTDIAKKINELAIDDKKANPATIHNELILNKKYVLIGRGIYALVEWGYTPGVVVDVIKEVLVASGKPMKKDDIIKEVMAKRIVKKSTIALALMNKKFFQKLPGNTYTLAS